ncbi:MAG: hypothetical protein ACOH2H_07750 [Cypionkella sp.]
MSGLFQSLSRRFAVQAPAAPSVLPRQRQRFEDEVAESGLIEHTVEQIAPRPTQYPSQTVRAAVPAAIVVPQVPHPAVPRSAPAKPEPQSPPVIVSQTAQPFGPIATDRPSARQQAEPPLLTDQNPKPPPTRSTPPDAAFSHAPDSDSTQHLTLRPLETRVAPRIEPRASPPNPIPGPPAGPTILPAQSEPPESRQSARTSPASVEPRVEIHIGRIDVATLPAPAPPRPAPAKPVSVTRPARQSSGLTDYLGWKR